MLCHLKNIIFILKICNEPHYVLQNSTIEDRYSKKQHSKDTHTQRYTATFIEMLKLEQLIGD